ncbi:DISARM system phospholipase D-like protein DrmC [Streptomyces sp. NPDC087894]|uniref:DISARM system phospholipase D-like protein DrmC n=1 Tax=Streptomyces sp. NPDC087894 TaxID=3365816 RepID=UPI00382AB662
MTDLLPELLATLGKRLPAAQLTSLHACLRDADGPSDTILDRWSADHPAAGLPAELSAVREAWRKELPLLPGAALALSLAAAAAAASNSMPPPELVVSGPTSSAIPIRLTSGIAIAVIRSAETSLLIASFAAYGIAEIVTELRAAAERDVRIDLILEERTSAARAFAPLRDSVRIWHRAHDSVGSSLHAKVIAADRRIALMGSANLTGRALRDNVEIGVILRDPGSVGRLTDHLHWLTGPEAGYLRRG